ncbi:MAG: PD-(D/E)XK nuclease family protein, partial [Acidimicrobiia bacterium]|nr:PD-(D/E)XK nuclease family protein [Acidimicrobiia bacterium]
VLELAEKRAAQEHRAHADVEMALAALEDSWDPGPFGGGPWSSAWKQRAVDTVTHLYEHWPASSQPALALERDVEMPLGGLSWRGRIDRIETDGDALRIVDYKSSRTLPTKSEVAESLQLGFYALAAAAELAGEVEAAEFWYPAQTGRKSLATFSLDLDRLPELTARLESAAEGIVAENWEPKPGQQCDRCRVRNLCPAWPEGQEAFS